MTIVDNNVLSAVAKIERTSLLPAVFETVGTPTTVIAELDRARTAGHDFVGRIDAIKSYNSGWLEIMSPTDSELRLADEIKDHALSTVDAHCLAIAANRDRRLVSDDAHVGTVGQQNDIEVWDLTLVLKAAIRTDVIADSEDLTTIIEELQRRDNYRFTAADRNALYAEL